jgi:hypothetical protein
VVSQDVFGDESDAQVKLEYPTLNIDWLGFQNSYPDFTGVPQGYRCFVRTNASGDMSSQLVTTIDNSLDEIDVTHTGTFNVALPLFPPNEITNLVLDASFVSRRELFVYSDWDQEGGYDYYS